RKAFRDDGECGPGRLVLRLSVRCQDLSTRGREHVVRAAVPHSVAFRSRAAPAIADASGIAGRRHRSATGALARGDGLEAAIEGRGPHSTRARQDSVLVPPGHHLKPDVCRLRLAEAAWFREDAFGG